jgi:hypothetical protein
MTRSPLKADRVMVNVFEWREKKSKIIRVIDFVNAEPYFGIVNWSKSAAFAVVVNKSEKLIKMTLMFIFHDHLH